MFEFDVILEVLPIPYLWCSFSSIKELTNTTIESNEDSSWSEPPLITYQWRERDTILREQATIPIIEEVESPDDSYLTCLDASTTNVLEAYSD